MSSRFADVGAATAVLGSPDFGDRRQSRLPGWVLLGVVLGVVLGMALTVLAGPFVGRYLHVHDDFRRGQHLSQQMGLDQRPRDIQAQCSAAAEAIYAHTIPTAGDGFAPPSEQAFYHGCLGQGFASGSD
jgi:gas vesicle protein